LLGDIIEVLNLVEIHTLNLSANLF